MVISYSKSSSELTFEYFYLYDLVVIAEAAAPAVAGPFDNNNGSAVRCIRVQQAAGHQGAACALEWKARMV